MKAMSQTRQLGEPPPKVWRLDQASLEASAHRTSHDGLENDAMCCTSHDAEKIAISLLQEAAGPSAGPGLKKKMSFHRAVTPIWVHIWRQEVVVINQYQWTVNQV